MPESTVNKQSLASLLYALPVNELRSLAQELELWDIDESNKRRLADSLSAYALERLEQYLSWIDKDRYDVLQQVMKAPNSALPFDRLKNADGFEPLYYHMHGLLILKKDEVCMPCEVMEKLRQMDGKLLAGKITRNGEWIRLAQGLLFYYGYLPTGRLIEKVEQYTGTPVDPDEFVNVIKRLESYDFSLQTCQRGFADYRVEDPDELEREQLSRPEIGYYPVSQTEALRASADGYVERHPAYVRFVGLLKTFWEMDKGEADATAADLTDRIRQGAAPSDLLGCLQEDLDMSDMALAQKLVDALMSLVNDTRLWELKGHSPNEVSALSKPSPAAAPESPGPVKAGRNDPCPCGSGKKYKKCCGAA